MDRGKGKNAEGRVKHELLRKALREHFGFADFRPGQEIAIGHLLRGQDTLVVMPTGAGKSLIYQLAALLLPGTTLVISPLISLMKDQTDFLNKRKLPATFINSSLGPAEQNRRLEALARGEYKLIYVAPERLRSQRFLRSLTSGEVNLLVVDEAHCISEWGHDFRPDYLHITPTCELLGNPTTVALTATATPRVQNDIGNLLGLTFARRLVTGFNRPNLTLEVRYLSDEKAKLKALAELLAALRGRGEEGSPEGGIVYTGTRRDAEEVAEFVRDVIGLPAHHYHAGLDPDARRVAQEAFLSGDLPVMAATNAFGMGLDRPAGRFAIHSARPGPLEAIYQEAGRGGRDGLPARAVLFYAPRDVAMQEYFIENDSPTLKELKNLHGYLRSTAPQGPLRITWPELEQATGLPNQKVKVGIQKLESVDALNRQADEGANIVLEMGHLSEAALNETWTEVLARREHKRAQLAKMQAYAETNQCRRRVILDHFGDHGSLDAPLCCDNCLVREEALARPASPAAKGPLTTSQQAALKVLDAIHTLSFPLGSHKVAQLLTGSRAKGPLRLGLDRHPLYGELGTYRLGAIRALIRRLIASGHLKQMGGRYPTLGLTAGGEAVLQAGTPIEVDLTGIDPIAEKQREAQPEAQRKAGGSMALTGELLAQGLTPEQIAAERGLAPSTIYSHLAQLIGDGKVEVEAVVPGEIREQIEETIRSVGSAASLPPLKARLPDHIDYNVIRCVARAWDLHPD